MTKRGMPALALALVLLLALAGTASAQSGRLAYEDAKRLAVSLAKKQVRDRDIVAYHLLGATRLGPNRIAFAYDDRSETNVYCTATIIVTRRVTTERTTITARFRGQSCAGIPEDALAVEAATRATARVIRGNADATAASLARLERSLNRCRNLRVPRARRAAARAILDVAVVQALASPNEGALDDFVAALGEIETTNDVLRTGVAGWADYVAVLRALPPFPDPCAALRRWARAGWAESASPIDMAEYRRLDRRAEVAERAIFRAARYLASVGVFPRVVVQFTPQGLLLRLAPELPASGGRGKVITLRKPALL